jgi:heme oxygenase
VNIDTASSHHALRQATADAHARIDAIVGGGVHSDVGYASYLRGMQQLVAVALQVMPGHHDLEQHRERLASDLSTLRMDAPPPCAADARASAPDPVARLGWEYVIAGASVGARYLLRQVQALGYSAGHGAQFLAGHAGSDAWPRFLARLAQTELSASQRQSLCSAALAAFAAAELAFQNAYRAYPLPETRA